MIKAGGKRVRHRSPHPLGEELRGVTLVSGGRGAFILVAPEHPSGAERWISAEAQVALIRAAARLGFGDECEGWYAVARAVDNGALADLLSEAVEETERDGARG